jgi:hypothetical protein
MKIFCSLLMMAVIVVGTSLAYASANIGGNWSITVDAGGQQVAVGLNLTQKDDTFTGTSSSDLGDGTIEQGKVTGSDFTALMKTSLQGSPVDIKMSGKVDGDKISGNLDVPGIGVLPFSGTKNKK